MRRMQIEAHERSARASQPAIKGGGPEQRRALLPRRCTLLVKLHRRLAEEHEIRWYDRDRPIDAEDCDFNLVTGLDGIGDDHSVRDVEALDRGRASDANAARYFPVDPHFGIVVHV